MTRLIIGFIGIMLIILGIGVFINPITPSSVYRTNIDLTNVRVPFSIFSTIFGITCLYLCITKKTKNPHLICPKCEEVYLKKGKSENHKCNNCNIQLEKLDGFYKKHNQQ
jgi:hypothetical protein